MNRKKLMHQKPTDSQTIQPTNIVLSLDENGKYSTEVWINGNLVGSGDVIGGFLAAYEYSQDILWNYDNEWRSPWG